MTKTYIIGHQKPDTDAVVATLALKHLATQANYWAYSNPIACITHPLNPETAYLFKKFDQAPLQLIKESDIKPQDKVALVDHNEEAQRLEGLNPDQIIDVIDHHKVNLNLSNPIYSTFKPWGSTNTIIKWLMDKHSVNIPKKLASLMLCAILSDTTGFKSSTTTNIDKQAAKDLAKIANLDIDKLTLELLKAKSNLEGLSSDQVVSKDYKVYNFNDKKVFVGQVETVEQRNVINNKKSQLLSSLKSLKTKEKYHFAFLALSDILKLNTKLLFTSQKEGEFLSKVFGQKSKDNLIDIGEKLSRKKDIVPLIERGLND